MKLYKHEFNIFKGKVVTTEFEVEEKPKTYVVKKEERRVWESRINKDEIGKLSSGWSKKMFSLSPDTKPYISELIVCTDSKINTLKNSLEKADEEKNTFLKLLSELENPSEEGGTK